MKTHYTYAIGKMALFSIAFFLTLSLGAQTFKQEAAKKKVYIGTIMKDEFASNQYANTPARQLQAGSDLRNQSQIAGSQFNAFEMENGMKMGNVISKNYKPSDFPKFADKDLNKEQIDRFLKFAKDNGNMRTRGHALLWYSQVPDWLYKAGPNGTPPLENNILKFMENYVKTVVKYTKGRVHEWDVANECLEADWNGKKFRVLADAEKNHTYVWYIDIAGRNKGGSAEYEDKVYNLIKKCFEWAHETDPAAELFYNDFSIEGENWGKSIATHDKIVKKLADEGAPITGVGFQSHFTADNFKEGETSVVAQVVDNIKKYNQITNKAGQKIQVHITEFDLRSTNKGKNQLSAARRHNAYWEMVSKTLAEPNCNLFLIWGINNKDSWIKGAFGETPYLCWNDNYSQDGQATGARGAWSGVYDGLRTIKAQNPSAINGTQKFPGVGGNTGGNTHKDDILTTTAPASVRRGTTAKITVNYSSSTNRDIIVYFQLNKAPWTVHKQVKIDVAAGKGTRNINVAIPADVPVANNAYQFNTVLTTNGGNWGTRLDNVNKGNINVTGQAAFTNLPGRAKVLTVQPNGIVWVVNSAGNAYRYNNGKKGWDRMPGGNILDIGAGGASGAGQIWCTTTNHRIYQWNGKGWSRVSGAAKSVDVDSNGRAWVVNKAGNIYYRNGNKWTRTNGGNAFSIGAGGKATVDLTVNNRRIYRRNGNGWKVYANGRALKVDIDKNGVAWVIGTNRELYKRVGSGWAKKSTGGDFEDLACGMDGSVYVTKRNGIIQRYNAGSAGRVGAEAEVASLPLEQDNVSLFPNPAASELNISGLEDGAVSFNIIDLNGQVVLAEESTADFGISSLNVSALNAGIYILSISQNGSVTNQRFVKQ